MEEYCNVSELLGKVITKIERTTWEDRLTFYCNDGTKYLMFHDQSCCESVTIEDISGDLNTLIGVPILMAEEVTNVPDLGCKNNDADSYTWTFYKFATRKGYVTIRWYGESNGCYSERVDFIKLQE